MASLGLPVPQSLEIHHNNAADKWSRFESAWRNYSAAIELSGKTEAVQVATFLTVIGEEARDVFATFAWTEVGDENRLAKVISNFKNYCQPRKNIPFERYMFNKRMQEPGESYDQYRTALRKLAENCNFQQITTDEILRDRLVFGIKDTKVRERLLREADLTLAKADDLCRAAESMHMQIKAVNEETINAVQHQQYFKKNKTWSEARSKKRSAITVVKCMILEASQTVLHMAKHAVSAAR